MQSVQSNEVVSPSGFSDEKLIASIQSARFSARRMDVQLLIMLAEIEERRLHLRMACSSIFDFCRRKLHMSEGEASRRMHASRLVRKLPGLIPHLEAGRIHLTTLTMLRDFLTESNIEELVTAAEGKTKDQVKELLASLAPRPDVPARLRKLPDRPMPAPASSTPTAAVPTPSTSADPQTSFASTGMQTSLAPPHTSRPARIEPLAPSRYKLEMTIGTAERDKLARVRALMRHRLPSGDLAAIFGEALDLLVAKLEKDRLGATSRPRAPRERAEATASTATAEGLVKPGVSVTKKRRAAATTPRTTPQEEAQAEVPTRYVARPVRRAVFVRDGEQCTFHANGTRCPARSRLELDHIRPFAQGGEPTGENLRVRCRSHNKLHAEDCFGTAYMKKRVEMRQRGRGEARE